MSQSDREFKRQKRLLCIFLSIFGASFWSIIIYFTKPVQWDLFMANLVLWLILPWISVYILQPFYVKTMVEAGL